MANKASGTGFRQETPRADHNWQTWEAIRVVQDRAAGLLGDLMATKPGDPAEQSLWEGLNLAQRILFRLAVPSIKGISKANVEQTTDPEPRKVPNPAGVFSPVSDRLQRFRDVARKAKINQSDADVAAVNDILEGKNTRKGLTK